MVRSTARPVTSLSRGYPCPLRGELFSGLSLYEWSGPAEAAAEKFGACTSPDLREHLVRRLYLHHLPLVREALARYCPGSGCVPGRCLAQELVGDTYPIFRAALESYDPEGELDFTPFVTRELRRGLDARAREFQRDYFQSPPPELAEGPTTGHESEEPLLDLVFAAEMLGHLDREDARLVVDRATGGTARELAEAHQMSVEEVRRRIRRSRARLRQVARQLEP